MNTIEGNKLIYKFSMPGHWEKVKNCSDSFFISFNYHRDWNQLMPVVEKIGNDHFVKIQMLGSYTIVSVTTNKDLPPDERKIYSQDECPKTAVYNAVIQFIQWYNENKGL